MSWTMVRVIGSGLGGETRASITSRRASRGGAGGDVEHQGNAQGTRASSASQCQRQRSRCRCRTRGLLQGSKSFMMSRVLGKGAPQGAPPQSKRLLKGFPGRVRSPRPCQVQPTITLDAQHKGALGTDGQIAAGRSLIGGRGIGSWKRSG